MVNDYLSRTENNIYIWRLGGMTVRALDLRSRIREFDFRSGRSNVAYERVILFSHREINFAGIRNAEVRPAISTDPNRLTLTLSLTISCHCWKG